ncbi:MAG: hypothetical protein ACTHNG_08385, partial [Ginsengibacter sp.]
FLLTGEASSLFLASKDGNTFVPLTLMLMPLAKINDRLFLESGLKMEKQDDGRFGFGLEVLNLHYRVNPWLTIHAGKFAAPWGNVLDMFGEGFVSRFPIGPIGLSDDGMAPTDQVGFGVQGGFQAGKSKMLYDFYLANGPQLVVSTDGTSDNMTGHMSYDALSDNNKNKAIGGKIGILPFSNSTLQIDAFGQYAGKTGDAGSPYENVSSSSYGADFNYYKNFNNAMLRLRGQYEETNTSNATYQFIDTSGPKNYTFNNKGNSWYLEGTVRPTISSMNFLHDLELGARYAQYDPPKNALWGGEPSKQFTLDLTYWFTWSSQINLGYNIETDAGAKQYNEFVIRTLYKF